MRFVSLLLSILAIGGLVVVVYIYHDVTSVSALAPDELALATVKIEIYQRFFEIFITIASLLGALSAVVGIGIYSILKKRIDRRIERTIEDRIRVSQSRTIGIAFNEFAYSLFRQYEPTLQRILNKSECVQDLERQNCLELICVAKDLANQGLEPFAELSEKHRSEYMKTIRGKRVRVNLLNQVLYCETARILVSGETPNSRLVDELVAIADELLDLGLGKELQEDNYNWWEAYETVGFFKWSVGLKTSNEILSSQGRTMILDLVNKQRPKTYLGPAPEILVETVHNEYRANGYDLPN